MSSKKDSVNKPTGSWSSSNTWTAREMFRVGAKAIESDFDRKARYIKYVCILISFVLGTGFLYVLFR